MLTVPVPTETEAATTTNVELIVLVLSASMVIGPPVNTYCESTLSASAITALTVPPMVLLDWATPTAPDRLNVPLVGALSN